MRKIIKNFENFSQPAGLVGQPDQSVIKLCFPKQHLGHLALFVSILTRSESELYTLCFMGFLTI